MITIVISRKINHFYEEQFDEAMAKCVGMANRVDGYVDIEILQQRNNPCCRITIMRFISLENWLQWECHPQRQTIIGRISPLLIAPEQITIYENCQLQQPIKL